MILSSQGGSGKAAWILINRMRWNKDLLGTKNGVNMVFTTPDDFIQDGEIVIRVYMNGVRLRLGSANDYEVSESGGVGTGYDTITFTGVAPTVGDELTADYMVQS